jgi:hypothetical protein
VKNLKNKTEKKEGPPAEAVAEADDGISRVPESVSFARIKQW